MSIEDDVARVHAVTDALVGPTKVWVLHEDSPTHGTIYELFTTADRAREFWKERLRALVGHHPDLAAQLASIDKGMNQVEFPHDTYWSLQQKEVK